VAVKWYHDAPGHCSFVWSRDGDRTSLQLAVVATQFQETYNAYGAFLLNGMLATVQYKMFSFLVSYKNVNIQTSQTTICFTFVM
jgi:hypothetical protein